MTVAGPKDLRDIDITILCGGLGTRIQSVLGNTPKILAPINDRPFLDLLLNWLSGFGARRVVLCLGHLADAVIEHLERTDYRDLCISTVVEPKPLGTGGALVNARHALNSETVMVLNGDSWVSADLPAFLAAHRSADTDVSVLCVDVPNTARFGRVEIRQNGKIERFVEKQQGGNRDKAGAINGGVYLISRSLLERLHEIGCTSFEKDFLGKQGPGSMFAYTSPGAQFIDIGIPADLAKAAQILPDVGVTQGIAT